MCKGTEIPWLIPRILSNAIAKKQSTFFKKMCFVLIEKIQVYQENQPLFLEDL